MIKKILIIRFSSIGDIVLTTPVIRAVKTQLPETQVHFAIKKQYRDLLSENPYIDQFHFLDKDLRAFIASLRKEKFDCIIDLHNNLRTRIIKWSLGIKAFSFNKLNIEKWLKVNFKIDMLPPLHIVDRYLAAAKPLGVKNDSQGLDFFIPEKDVVSTSSLPAAYQSGYVAYAIGGQHNTKRLPVEKMIELCAKIDRPIVLLGGKEDFADGEQVKAFFDGDKNHLKVAGKEISTGSSREVLIDNACGRYNLHQSASVAQQADVVFAHDTGMMHIAAALKKKIVSIWGNTAPVFGMYPYKTQFSIVENNQLKCRPCSKIGFDKCPKGHFNCMRKINLDFCIPE